MGASLVLEIETQLTAGGLRSILEHGGLWRRWRGPLTAVDLDPVGHRSDRIVNKASSGKAFPSESTPARYPSRR